MDAWTQLFGSPTTTDMSGNKDDTDKFKSTDTVVHSVMGSVLRTSLLAIVKDEAWL